MIKKGWLPYRLVGKYPGLQLEWLYTGNKPFTEPFFDDTIRAVKYLEEYRMLPKPVSAINSMIEMGNTVDATSPVSIIFHVSRCGSTLLTQMLCCDEQNLVLSEVPFFDDILRLLYTDNGVDQTLIENYLLAGIRVYSEKRNAHSKNLFIKTDSWHLHFYSIYRKLFPSVPFVLLYRHPMQVMQSHKRQRGLQSVPGLIEPAVFGFTSEEAATTNLDAYMAKVLTSYFQKILFILQLDSLAMPFNYSEGILNIAETLYAASGLALDNELKSKFAERSTFHAKHPHQIFSEEMMEEVIPEYLLEVCDLYEKIEQLRINKQLSYNVAVC